ncbi:MAG: gliding motility-associated ABC transporter ATP-binding subunit GldA [Bacteroidetes bacterium]|jgi:ABC-2 type transport system ATP-binding protein|nr:gliding motility-associated ABC transporter ATP-binding subunit GldA [Bacteroidota bacterium]
MEVKVLNLTKQYANQLALDSISFELKPGEIVGLLGPNGAGKSTLMKLLTGYLQPSKGDVYIDNLLLSENVLVTQQKIGYLPEHNPLYTDMYVKEYLEFVAGLYKLPTSYVSPVIEQVGLTPEVHKKIHQLSKGYRQRIGLAAAILHQPKLIILDEPTTGLDPNQLVEIRSLIKELGKENTVLFSSHILQEIEAVCDRVILIHKGKIVHDMRLNQVNQQTEQLIEVEFDLRVEEQLLYKLPNIKKVQNIFDATWELTFETQQDMRSKLFDYAQQNGLRVLKMISKNKNLESLFKELTAN